MSGAIHSRRCVGCNTPHAPGDLEPGGLCKDCRAALRRGWQSRSFVNSVMSDERDRIREGLLTEISNLSAGRLGHSPEAAHVLLAVRAAIDRICPEAGK